MRKIFALGFALIALASCSTQSPKVFKVRGKTGIDIQNKIDKAFAAGGGRVVVPAGVYNVGTLRLRSNVELNLKKDALILGSDKSEEYESFPEEVSSMRPCGSSKVLIYAYDEKNIAITGDGVIDGQGPKFFDVSVVSKGYYQKPPVERPVMVRFHNCDGIRLEGVTFSESPCWTIFLRLCSNIEVSGITLTADQKMINNDGIDFDGCRHVRVSGANIKTCDDCIVLRAMRDYPEHHVVCEDVIVTDCILDSRCQAVRLGCPSDDTIRDATFRNIKACGNNGIFADYPVRYLRPGDDGFMDISDITFENFSGEFGGSALQIVSQPGVRTRRVDGMVFRGFDVKSRRPLRFIGNKGSEIAGVLLEDFKVEVTSEGNPIVVQGCDGLVFRNVSVNGAAAKDGTVLSEPGSDAVLERGVSDSWEAKKW